MLYYILHLLLSALASLVAVRWVYLKILHIANRKGLVDAPDARKNQTAPVPVLGGIAVFFGLVTGILCFYMILAVCLRTGLESYSTAASIRLLQNSHRLVFAVMGATIMLYIGALDDILNLSPTIRLVIETCVLLAVIYGTGFCVDSLHGLWGIHSFSWLIGVPLTVFACVGIINAINMVDGVNGLSSGLCISASCLFAGILFWGGDVVNSALALCYAASLVPFFCHNVFGKRSRMFIGDSGTMVMGFLVSWFVICILNSGGLAIRLMEEKSMNMVAMLYASVAVPVTDTIRVMCLRIARGQSPFRPDRTHLHHAFLDAGFSHLSTSLSEILINLVIIASWLISYRLHAGLQMQLYVTVFVALLLVAGPYFVLSYHIRHDTPTLHRIREFTPRTHWGHTRWWLRFQAYLDRGADENID